MAIKEMTSLNFNQNPDRAMKAARNGPIMITNDGQPTHVLLTIEDYRNLVGHQPSIVDLLAMPDTVDIEFDPPRLKDGFWKRRIN